MEGSVQIDEATSIARPSQSNSSLGPAFLSSRGHSIKTAHLIDSPLELLESHKR